MSVIRINKTRDYTVMSNFHFKDKRLSLKAKGLLSQMLSLPDDWDYTVEGLCYINKENKTSIQSALKELEECGYLIRTRKQDDMGRFIYEYDIYEQPIEEKPCTENLFADNPCTEKQPQLNTKESKTKNKRSNIKDLIYQYTDNDELAETLLDFEKMRKTIKKPLTEKAWKLLFNRLDKIAVTDCEKIQCLNQSIEHCWQSVYEVKDKPINYQNKGRLGWIDDVR